MSEALPGRYRRSGRSAWFANIATWNDADVFETGNGWKLFKGVVPGQSPGSLLGSPTYEAEEMAVVATGDDYVLVYGDFDHYVVADRFSSVEFIPHLFGANQRPTGQRGICGFFRKNGHRFRQRCSLTAAQGLNDQ